ncbi:MAG: hypothetical protein P8141_00485 [Gammaproteobacteria bacterium]
MVVEGIGVEMNNVGITPNMLCMARFARKSVNVSCVAVKSFTLLYVSCHFLMALETQAFLCGLFEGFVTLLALGFIFGMGVDHLARHDQGFET